MNLLPDVRKRLNGTHLKLIAICLMLIDHASVIILEKKYLRDTADYIFTAQGTDFTSLTYKNLSNLDTVFRIMGRPSFFLFAYLLVEGFLHTGSLVKYALRLFLFALLSEVPFDYALKGSFSDFDSQNVLFTLFLGLVSIIAMDFFRQKINNRMLLSLAMTASFLVPGLLARLIRSDYGIFGVAIIGIIYISRYNLKNQFLFITLLIMMSVAFQLVSPIEIFGIFSYIFIYLYNGERGTFRIKYLFYFFYPLHLIILKLLADYVL